MVKAESRVTEILSADLLAELKRLELRTRRTLSADIMGNYRSAFRGSGLVFSDVREYAPGDEIRSIHWKATARGQKVYVKSYHEDRSIEVMVCVDISASTGFAAVPHEKATSKSLHRKAFEIAASVALLAQQSGDAVGLMLFGESVKQYERPRSGRRAVEHLLLSLLRGVSLDGGTDLAGAIEHVLKYQRRRSVVFVISDFFAPDFERQLSHLSRRHEVVMVYLEAIARADFAPGSERPDGKVPLRALPRMGLVAVRDPETGARTVVDTSSKSVMQALEARLQKHWATLSALARSQQVDLVRVQDERVLHPLVELMHRRQSQRGGDRSHIVDARPSP